MRQLKGTELKIIRTLILAWVGVLFYTALAGQLPPMVHQVFAVGGAAVLTYWLLPFRKKETPGTRAGLTDYLGILLVLLTCGWAGINATGYMLNPGTIVTRDVIFGAITIIWLLEAARRTVGIAIPLIFIFMLLYAILGPYLPWIFWHPSINFTRAVGSLYTIPDALWGTVTRIMTITIPAFIIYGAVVLKCGGAQVLINVSAGLAGRYTGGPAKIAVIASGLFGMINGSSVANAATTGSVTIPMMKKMGYEPHVAASVESCASAGGLIMPPVMGAGAFLMATFLGIPYLTVALAAFIPACLYFFGVFMGVHFQSVKAGIGRMSKEEVSEARHRISLLKLAPLALSFGVLVYMIAVGRTPQSAAFWGTVIIAVLYMLTQGPLKDMWTRFKDIVAGFESAGSALMMVIILGASIQMVVYLIGISGIGVILSQLIFGAAGTSIFLALFLVMLICIFLGMGVPSTAAYVM
ncbi:TRAP transporter permease, partial [Chloroflexota bacterium]